MTKVILVSIAFALSSITLQAQKSSCKKLVSASKSNNVSLVKTLLKTVKADCIYRSGEPRTPLVAASRKGSFEVVKLLLEANANVDFHVRGDESPLMAASANGHISIVNYLIKNKASINKTIKGDGTALISAVKNNHYQIAKILLENNADPDLAVRGDEYPMYHARMAKNKVMIALLKKHL